MTKNRLDYSCLSLPDADFRNSDLSNASFRYSYLNRADFKNATCKNVDFSYADLSKTDFRGADLTGAVFDFADTTDMLLDVLPDLRPTKKFILYISRVERDSIVVKARDLEEAEAIGIKQLDDDDWEIDSIRNL